VAVAVAAAAAFAALHIWPAIVGRKLAAQHERRMSSNGSAISDRQRDPRFASVAASFGQ